MPSGLRILHRRPDKVSGRTSNPRENRGLLRYVSGPTMARMSLSDML